MIIVIQCAASKRVDAGRLNTASRKPVEFVADIKIAPPDPVHLYARPDDLSDTGLSWREVLLNYNREVRDNPLGLCAAYELYDNKVYGRLADRFGTEALYILSAGWGLVRAKFLIPHYDITFSQNCEPYKRRKKADAYDDFQMLPEDADGKLLFFGGRDYLPLFSRLTDKFKGTRIVFYNSAHLPKINRCTLIRFETTTRTNWHYECAHAFLTGTLQIE